MAKRVARAGIAMGMCAAALAGCVSISPFEAGLPYAMKPVVFGMDGRWDVVAQAQLPDGAQFFAVFPVLVGERSRPPR